MLQKPAYLGPYYAAAFQQQSVVDAYPHRRAYPPATFAILADLIVDQPRAVLDVGCGTGDVARSLVDIADQIDAVDFSEAMISRAKALPNGDHPHISWIHARAEDALLRPPYALITAGQSLHWMDWNVVLPRFRDALTPCGSLALVSVELLPVPWSEDVVAVIRRYSTNQDYVPFDMIPAWDKHGLFRQQGERRTEPEHFTQPIESYIESFHGMSSLSRERMGLEQAAAFDAEVRQLVTPYARNGLLELAAVGSVLWGRPGPGINPPHDRRIGA